MTFVLLLAAKWLVEEVLDKINGRHILRHRTQIPSGFEQFIDLPTYQKSVDYTLTKATFSSFCKTLDLGFSVIIIFFGLLPWLFGIFTSIFGPEIVGQAAVLLCVKVTLSLVFLPFSWWRQFRLEESFGFNRSTQAIFWTDKIKEIVLTFALCLPIVSAIIYLFQTFPGGWWILGWAALTLFQAAMVIIYPLLILPIFNKLTPLPDGELKDRLISLGQAVNFPVNKICTMDGSKRSTHSNAFFIGLGQFRHIVLYDTLIQQMSTEEIAAVVAHEIGHYKCKHIATTLIIESIFTLLGFRILHYLSGAEWFLNSFGFAAWYMNSPVPLILVFLFAIPGVTFWIEPFFKYLSRRHEYAADRFAAVALGGGASLISGLRKLHRKNLSNLTPHPIFSAFYYSHPTLLDREAALKK
jgi:STE24 endopeptidase